MPPELEVSSPTRSRASVDLPHPDSPTRPNVSPWRMENVTSLTDVLAHWANQQPNARAYVFLKERGGEDASLTFGQLKASATTFAARIAERALPGERAILLFQPGLDFIVAFFGCLQAGVIAVPLMVPRRASERDSSAAILADCTPRLLVTNRSLAESRPDVAERLHDTPFESLLIDAVDETDTHPSNMGPFVRRRDDIVCQFQERVAVLHRRRSAAVA